ncbi:MAG: hypothetical protein QXZ31_08655 [Thermofilaceae archaeon]
MSEKFLRMVEEARKLTSGPFSFEQGQRFIQSVREWVEEQPDWLKKSIIGRISTEGVQAWSREEFVNELAKNRELMMSFARFLAAVPPEKIRHILGR